MEKRSKLCEVCMEHGMEAQNHSTLGDNEHGKNYKISMKRFILFCY